MKGAFSLLLVLFCLQSAVSQNEAAIWYFGENAGLDFKSGSPVVLEDGGLSTVEGCATYSDAKGNLLFYTDGRTVWDRNHQIMPNGTDLKGHSSSTQSGIIIPAPGDPNRYYIFTSYFQAQGGLYYSEVDLSLNGGMGDIRIKNSALENPTAEKLTAVKHENGTDIWVIGHDWGNDAYLAYLVTGSGVNTNPIISNVGFDLNYPTEGNDVFKSRGYLKTSPDGSKIAVCHSFVGAELLDFDTATGKVSNPLVLAASPNSDFYGIEFSPYGSVLYLSILNDDIYQFDLMADDIVASKFPLNIPNKMTGGLQLALDGKIYVASFEKLSVIDFPELLGSASGFKGNAIDLGSGTSTYGLPPFITSLFNLGIQAENFCIGDVTEFTVTATEPIDTAEWDFGDGHTSTMISPSHTYDSPGSYTVNVTIRIGTRIKTETREITIYETPLAYDATYVQCDSEETGVYAIDLLPIDTDILGGQDPAVFQVSYFATESDAGADQNALPKSGYFNTEMDESIYARVTRGDCYSISEVSIHILTLPKPVLKESYVVCPDNPELTLDGGDFETWAWRNDTDEVMSTSRIFDIYETGDYSLTVSRSQLGMTCEQTLFFEVVPLPVLEDFTTQVNNFADQITIDVDIQQAGNFEYSIDGENFQDSDRFDVLPGKYTIFVRDEAQCRTISKEVVALGYQKFFTPNGDGINDYWNIIGSKHSPNSTVFIFDRYGKLLQQVGPMEVGWNGTYHGEQLPASDYWFRFVNDDGFVFTGHFTLKR